jgi:uncharacterized membrane protein YkoI
MRKLIASLTALALVSGAFAVPAAAQSNRGDQASAREEMTAGRTLPVREIERRVIPQMRGHDYLSFEYDGAQSAYRLKFIKDGQVVWVDVDARTARILRISR